MADHLAADTNTTSIDNKTENTIINHRPNVLLTQPGGGGDGNGLSSTTVGGGVIPSSPSGDASPSTANGPSGPLQQQSSQKLSTTVSPAKQDPSQKDFLVTSFSQAFAKPPLPSTLRGQNQESLGVSQCFNEDELANVQENYLPPSTDVPLQGPNELFFGADRSGLSYKDREDRVRQLRERQQLERHQKLEELKEQAASAQRFREQQETARRLRLDELRSKDSERRVQVEERKRIIQQAEQERREAVLRKSAEREQRLELKRRQERSNAVFAFGSSTPRMLDPKENVANYWGARKATSTTNVNLSDSSPTVRRSSECQDTSDLSRKRATSAHSLNRKPEDLRMSTSMYEVFNWDDGDSHTKPPFQSHASSQGEDPMTQSLIAPPPTAARRRTDLLPAFPSLRDSTTARGSPRHRSPGFRSGTITPGSPSRPTSALSQVSGGSQVSLRNRTSPKKPRPLSIAGSTLSSADKPRDSISSSAASPASPNRESRSIERKSSAGIISTKPLRAKSVGSDSAPSTPAKTPSRGTTPKRTPAQVKAESNAKRASERLKSTPKSRSASKTTPLSSPSVESKTLPSSEKKNTTDDKVSENAKAPIELKNLTTDSEKDTTAEDLLTSEPSELVPKLEETKKEEKSDEKEVDVKLSEDETKEVKLIAKEEPPLAQTTKNEDQTIETRDETSEEKSQTLTEEKDNNQPEEKSQFQLEENLNSQPEDSAQIQPEEVTQTQFEEKAQPSSTEKPVTGYATEEDYKVALAEKRRQAREAKERELELERLRKLEEEERERREEEEYLKLMEDQKKAEEERLKRAIEEAEKQRQEEAIRREEEEKLRIETEKIEQQKKLEAEEKMRKEEEERQMRKSRVAAIMSRTRGKGGGGSTPSKAESKTPSDENKNLNDSLMSASMTEAILNNLSNSMTDSMIVQVIESQEEAKKTFTSQDTKQIKEESAPVELLIQPPVSTAPCQATSDGENVEILTDVASDNSSQPLSDFSSQPLSDLSSQPLSDISIQTGSMVEVTPQPSSDVQMESVSIESSTLSQDTQETVREMVEEISKTNVTDTTVYIETSTSEDLNSSMECMQFVETRANGNVFDLMDTTPTMQSMDLLGSFNGVNGINHNGMDTVSIQSSGRSGNQFDSFDPFSTSLQQTIPTSDVKSDTTTFDQIIDLNQSKLTNEDAMNSNNPPSPIIAFEDNMNKKQSQQHQDNTSNVPDLLL